MQNFVLDAIIELKGSLPTEFCGLIHLSLKSKNSMFTSRTLFFQAFVNY